MSYTLYGCRRSGSFAVELALAELGVDYTLEEVDLETEAQRGAAYAKVNPQRKLPALLTPAGETLTESVAILLTLDERHRDGRREARGRAPGGAACGSPICPVARRH